MALPVTDSFVSGAAVGNSCVPEKLRQAGTLQDDNGEPDVPQNTILRYGTLQARYEGGDRFHGLMDFRAAPHPSLLPLGEGTARGAGFVTDSFVSRAVVGNSCVPEKRR